MQNGSGVLNEVGTGPEVDGLLADVEAVDQALGSELLLRLAVESHAAAMPAAWWRKRILSWCGSPSTKRAFGREITISTEMAMRDMDDRKILTLVRHLLARAASLHASTAMAAASEPRR